MSRSCSARLRSPPGRDSHIVRHRPNDSFKALACSSDQDTSAFKSGARYWCPSDGPDQIAPSDSLETSSGTLPKGRRGPAGAARSCSGRIAPEDRPRRLVGAGGGRSWQLEAVRAQKNSSIKAGVTGEDELGARRSRGRGPQAIENVAMVFDSILLQKPCSSNDRPTTSSASRVILTATMDSSSEGEAYEKRHPSTVASLISGSVGGASQVLVGQPLVRQRLLRRHSMLPHAVSDVLR